MKNIKYALVVLAAVVSAASCTEEIENDKPVLGGESAKGDLIINAVAGSLGKSDPDTKAHGVYGYDVVWDQADKIAVADGEENQGIFNLIEGAGEILGKFQQASGPALTGDVTGYYPASLLQADGTLSWPAIQNYSKELTGIPMAASAAIAEEGGTNFNFKNLDIFQPQHQEECRFEGYACAERIREQLSRISVTDRQRRQRACRPQEDRLADFSAD